MANESIDKFKDVLTHTTAAIGVKTSVFVGSAKAKTQIRTLKREINEIALTLGNTIYELWEKGEDDRGQIEVLCKRINEKYADISSLNIEIANLEKQEEKVLGTKKTDSTIDSSEGKYICPKCKSEFGEPAKFCRRCGTRMGA